MNDRNRLGTEPSRQAAYTTASRAALAAFALLGGPVAASAQSEPSGPLVVYLGAHVWTGGGFEVRDVWVREGLFVEAGVPDSSVDLSGGWVVPPFGDAHSHTLGAGEYAQYYAGSFLEDGIFYGLDLTNPYRGSEESREDFRRPETVDVGFAYGGLSRRTGTRPHPASTMERIFGTEGSGSLEGDAYWSLDEVSDVGAMWDGYMAQDPDVVKVYVMYAGDGEDGCGYGLCPAVLQEVVRRAHEAGKRVFAHVNTSADVRVSLDAGVDGIAHLPLGNDGIAFEGSEPFVLDDDLIAEIGGRGLVVTPTSHLLLKDQEGFPRDTLSREIGLQADQLRRLHTAGARLALSGHDWRVTSLREAEYWNAYQVFDRSTILRLWAETTPQVIFPDRRIGRIAPGYEASLLVLDGNPLEDFGAVTRIRMRLKQGRTPRH